MNTPITHNNLTTYATTTYHHRQPSPELLVYITNNVSCHPFGPLLVNTDAIQRLYLSISILSGLLSTSTVMLNTLVFIAMITSRQYRAPANHLLIMLNTIDLAAGLLLIPLYAVYMSQLQHGTIDCVLGKVLMVAGYSITIISTITIGFMTSQLYHAILNPFKYHRRVSNKSTYIPLVSSIWIVIITSVFVFVFILPAFWNLFKLVTGTIFLIIYCSLCIAHKKIYSSTRMILKSNDQSKQSLVTNRKTLKMVTTVLLAFGLTFLPFVVYAIYITICGLTPFVRSFYSPCIEIVAMSNSLLNPCIYCFRLKTIRKRVLGLLLCRSGQKTDRKFAMIKRQTGIPVNSVNLSIITTSITSLSSIKFNNETKYADTTSNNKKTLLKALSNPSTHNSNRIEEDKTLDICHRKQANVLKTAKFLFLP